MQKLSQIISKPVFSLYEGLWLGTIINVCINFSSRKIKGFFVLSSDEENSYFVKGADIENIGDDAVILKNASKLAFIDCDSVNILNKRAISVEGEDFGMISELFFDNDYNVLSLETNKKVLIPFKKIVNLGDDAAIIGYENSKFKKAACKPKSVFAYGQAPEMKVTILNKVASNSVTGAELKTIGEVTNLDSQTELTVPKKIKQNPYFLLGRTASNSVKSDTGDIIVKEGQKITEKSISKAQIYNMIYELSSCAN